MSVNSVPPPLTTRDAYPRHADEETRQFARYWFDGYARRQLTSLSVVIGRVQNEVIRDVLWCGLSRLIITKQSGASLAMDLSHSRPHRSFRSAPVKPFRGFLSAVDRVVQNCIDKDVSNDMPAVRAQRGDARRLPLDDASVDLVLTSPPYLNAIDYMRCSKFSLVWMGHSIAALRRLRSESIGTEVGKPSAGNDADVREIVKGLKLRPALAKRDGAVLARYIEDMRATMREVARVLVPGGRAVYVVGENTVRGTYIKNATIVTSVAELSALRLDGRFSRALPMNRRYLPPPSAEGSSHAMNGRMRREVVLAFSRPLR